MSYKFTGFLRSSEFCYSLKLIHVLKKWGRLSSTASEILAFGSHCSANFQMILDCFIPKFKLKYDNLENIKTDGVNTVVFNLHQIKQSIFFGTPDSSSSTPFDLEENLSGNKTKVVCE